MAGQTGSGDTFNPQSYLSPNQQDLLLAALTSNMNGNKNQQDQQFSASNPDLTTLNMEQFNALNGLSSGGTLDPSFFTSPAQNTSLSTFDAFGVDDSPYIDFVDGGEQYDLDDLDNEDDMIGPLPGAGDGETDGKRKNPDGGQEENENSPKRQEGEDKTAKKPGRKPLTSEPTNKRKAQNRAAQRAFRERKEKHLKDLETKVEQLEKQSEAEKHENGLLRAQVDRLQTELREYRKRLSGSSPSVSSYSAYLASLGNRQNSNSSNNNGFQFEFPRFGNLPGAHIFNNGALGNKVDATRSNSTSNAGRSVSPKSPSNAVNGINDTKTNDQRNRAATDSSSPQSRIFQFNSNSSISDSPSASSISQFGGVANSSCGTSPEPVNSPEKDANLDTVNEKGYVCRGNSEGEITFCEKLNMACGNPLNPVPRAKSLSNMDSNAVPAMTPAAAAATSTTKTPGLEDNTAFDWLANQNGGQFDPTLFGDYRESTAAIVGEGDFTGGFFNDAFGMPEFGTPFNMGEPTPATQKNNPIDEIERLQEGGDDEVVPGEDRTQMLSCHKIWDKLQQNPDFNEGTFDVDSLCSELRAKARCSETGVVVDQKDVDAAIKRLPSQPQAVAK